MPQPRDIQTGLPKLDKDLQDLFETCESKKLAAVKQALADQNISPEKLSELVPKGVIRLSSLFLNELYYRQFLQRRSEHQRQVIQRAKALFTKHFSDIVDNKSYMSLLKEEASEKDSEEDSLVDRTIMGMSYITMWLGKAPDLVPAARIGIKDRRGKIVLETTEDWDDISNLIASLTAALKRLLKNGKSLAENKQIDFEYAERVGKHLQRTKKALSEIEELAPLFQISMDNSTDEDTHDSDE